MCFDHMIKKARSGGYGSTPTEWISNVEADLLVLVSNAIIYYGHAHPTNKAALAVYEAVQAVLQEWQAFHLLCSVCGGDELDVENSVTICDGCCKGFHRLCTKETLEGETPHDLRRDSAWYCSSACRSSFEALASRFQLADDFRGVQVVPEVRFRGDSIGFEIDSIRVRGEVPRSHRLDSKRIRFDSIRFAIRAHCGAHSWRWFLVWRLDFRPRG
jgi:hypothetical protein